MTTKMHEEVFINGKRYVPAELSPLSEEAKNLLADVYGKLWIAACYDPDSEEHREWAKPLCDKMSLANAILGFKK